MSKNTRQNLLIGLIDFLLLNISLAGVHWIKRGSLELSPVYIQLFAVFYVAWLGTSLAMNKFKLINGKTFCESLWLIVKSNVVMVYLVSFFIVLWNPRWPVCPGCRPSACAALSFCWKFSAWCWPT